MQPHLHPSLPKFVRSKLLPVLQLLPPWRHAFYQTKLQRPTDSAAGGPLMFDHDLQAAKAALEQQAQQDPTSQVPAAVAPPKLLQRRPAVQVSCAESRSSVLQGKQFVNRAIGWLYWSKLS